MQELDRYLETGDERKLPSAPAKNGSRPVDLASTFFSEAIEKSLHLLVCLPGSNEDVVLRTYGEHVARLLRAETTCWQANAEDRVASITKAVTSCDLLIFGEPQQSAIEKFILGPVGRRVARKAPTTILVVKRPRWPIQKILLVMRVEALEEGAVDWAGRFVRASDAHLTILPLVPTQPLMYGAGGGFQIGVESLLTPNTPTGERLRCFLDRLKRWQVRGTLRVRQGEPLGQICWEIDEGGYDLVIIGAEQGGRVRRWLFGDLVSPLINLVNRPLLIAAATRQSTPELANQ